MKKLLAMGIILLLVCVSIPSTGRVMEKSSTMFSDGTTLYVGGDGPGNYTKIQKAIDAASDGDTVFVYNGTYIENVVVDKSINLIGENRDTTEIFSYGDFHYVVYISDDWVNISGFTIRHYEYEDYFIGIKIGSNNNNITGNKITKSGEAILLLDYSNYNTVTGNIIFNTFTGIWLSYSSNNIINDNNITKNWNAILAYESNNNTFLNNYIFDNVHSIILAKNCINNTITGNHILENICCTCIGVQHNSNNNTISNNTIDLAWWLGIGLEFSFNNTVVGNMLSNCGIGVLIWNSSDNIITKNTIRNCDEHGILCTTFPLNYGNHLCDKVNCMTHLHDYSNSYEFYSSNNIIYHNNLINNAQNAYDEFNNIWDNGYPSGGNYWDDYNGTDDDGDGIGDISYIIPGNDNEDRYPLMQPVDFELPDPKTVYVNDDFNSTIFGWGYDHFNNIQDGIDAVEERGTVYVYTGNYKENLVVNKTLNLIGEDKDTTVIDGNRVGTAVSVTAQRVKITGFKIKNGALNTSQNTFGIEISSSNCTVSGNIILNNTKGIGVCYWKPHVIFNNTITNNIVSSSSLDGIIVHCADNNTVSKNIINYCEFIGLCILNSKNNYVKDNIINGGDGGGLDLSTCSNTIVTGNIIKSSKFYGILLSSGNPLDDGACNNLISGNIIINNRCGIKLDDSSNNNIIEKNNFIGNKKQVSLEHSWNNSWKANYWDKWIGHKLNISIFQNFPKIIIGWRGFNDFIPLYLNFDWHPAKEPYDIEV